MKTILIIEDESHDRNDIARILGNEGYKIHRSFGATDGIMIAERYLPDLILLDLFDKQKTLDTISRISSEPELLDIPLVAYTSIEDPNYLQELFVNGSDGFLRKPFSKKKSSDYCRDAA